MPAKTKTGVLGLKESASYLAGSLGSGMIYSIMSTYILDFYMNVMDLKPQWLFVLLLMLLARIWDAVNDPLMGVLMDRLNPKRGKMRTWLFAMPAPVMLFTVLLFLTPEISIAWKMVYASVTYVGWGMTFTAMDIPFWSLPLAMTPHADERGTFFSLGRTVNGVGAAIPMVLYTVLGPLLEKTMSNQQAIDTRKFLIMAVVCALAGGILIFITPFHVKERVPLPKAEKDEKGALRRVLSCKPLMMTALMGILSGGRYLYQAGTPHMARWAFYIEGKTIQESMSFVTLVLQGAVALGMFGSMIAVPFLLKRFNYKQLLISSCLVGGLAGLATYIVGYENFWPIVPLLFLSAIPVGIINVVAFGMVGDALDFMEWGTGFRANGLGLACQSFVIKLANALATSAVAVIYPIVGLDASESQATRGGANLLSLPMAQRGKVRGGFFSLISIVPAVSLLLSIVPILFYDLTGEKKATIMRELAQRREAEAAEEEGGT